MLCHARGGMKNDSSGRQLPQVGKPAHGTVSFSRRCGTVLDRDENAAQNILALGLSTTGHVGTNAWGENDLCLDLATGLDKLAQ